MPELNVGALVSAVQKNCDISDAQFAGDLTMCTFLLKMRELYRWEHDIPLSQDMPRAEVGSWMNAREQLWDQVEGAPYATLPLPGGEVDPFEAETVNQILRDHGLVYSGGYGRGSKPHFFLASLTREEQRDGFRVLVSGCEYARDLDAPPGMLLDRTIFVRGESLRRWLWQKVEEWRWSRHDSALGRALACYAFEADSEAALTAMTERETELVIRHELGEALAETALGEAWPALLADLLRSRAEIVARAVRDLYADSVSTLPALLQPGQEASIHFYFANFTGMRRQLFPELVEAYEQWLLSGDLAALQQIAESGRERWLNLAGEMLALHRQQGADCRAAIEARFLAALQN